MTRNKKPRKAYRPRPVTAHTLATALHFAAKPSAADCAEVLAILHTALTALREGVATEHQWSIAAGSVSVAMAMERRGIVRGLAEHWQAAEEALQAIYDRAVRAGGSAGYRRTALHYTELDALRVFAELHEWQIKQLGRGEFLESLADAQRVGIKEGFKVTMATDGTDVERMAA